MLLFHVSHIDVLLRGNHKLSLRCIDLSKDLFLTTVVEKRIQAETVTRNEVGIRTPEFRVGLLSPFGDFVLGFVRPSSSGLLRGKNKPLPFSSSSTTSSSSLL